MAKFNTIEYRDAAEWNDITKERSRGLLSFSNHVSLFDDPLLISNLGTTAYKEVRWIAADHKNFFSTKLKGFVFSAGKCVPIIRGGGLKQPGFDFLIDRLKHNDWVHIFPEGGRTREAKGKLKLDFKLGIGSLLAQANPIALPFYHYGMHDVLPIGAKLPRVRKKVIVQFGKSTTITPEWIAQNCQAESPVEIWKALRDWSKQQLLELEEKTRPTQSKN